MKKVALLCLFMLIIIAPAHAQTSPPIITSENATRLTEIHRIGDGVAQKIAYSPTGNTFTVLSAIGAWVYEAINPETPPFLLAGHTARARFLAYSPDGQFLVTTGDDFRLQVWHIPSQKLATTIKIPSFHPSQVEFRADGQMLIMHENTTVQFVSLVENQVVYDHVFLPNGVLMVDFHPLGTQFIATMTGSNRRIALYTISNPQFGQGTTITETMSLPAPPDVSPFEFVTYSANASTIIGATEDGTIALWDAQTGELLRSYVGHDIAESTLTHLYRGNDIFVTTTERGYLKAWSYTGDLLAEMTIENLIDVALAPDDQSAMILAQPNTTFAHIYLWDITTNTRSPMKTFQNWMHVTDMDVAPDGESLAIASSFDMLLVNSATWQIAQGYGFDIEDVAFHPTDSHILAVRGFDTLAVNRLQTDLPIASWIPDSLEDDLVFSPDGELIATALANEVLIRQVNDDSAIPVRIGGTHRRNISNILFTPDSQTVLIAHITGGQIEFWDPRSAELIRTIQPHTRGMYDIAFHPESESFVTVSDDGTLKIHDATTYETQLTISLTEAGIFLIYTLAYSPDGNLLVGGRVDGQLFIIDAQSGALLHSMLAHRSMITKLEFSPDGSRLYSAGFDGAVRVWGVPPS